jgi:hypothetical protein
LLSSKILASVPERFFSGRVEGWAAVEKLLGRLRNRATILGEGSSDDGASCLTFTETYTFDDDQKDTLNWRIVKLGEGQYRRTETRLKGEAEDEQAGSAFHGKRTSLVAAICRGGTAGARHSGE